MKKFLLATTCAAALTGGASAADLPMKAAPQQYIPVTSWTGGYIGGHIGAGSASVTGNQIGSSTGGSYGTCTANADGGYQGLSSCSTVATGVVGGVQIGYDFQNRSFVYGVVADWSWTDLKKHVTNSNSSLPFFHAKVDWLASIRGRMGLAVEDTMVYVTGGVAFAELKSSAGQLGGGASYSYENRLSTTKVGWVAGGGIEHKWNRNWSVFGEALYYGFPTASVTSSSSDATVSYTTEFTHNIVVASVGVNYRW
jgi:outer membrane immunogenic protein